MIGVSVDQADHEVVRELFELFKTPWEFYAAGRPYEVILASAEHAPALEVPAKILFGSRLVPEIDDAGVVSRSGCSLVHAAGRLPVYGSCLIFQGEDSSLPLDGGEGSAAAHMETEGGVTIRLGYDLLDEIRFLLVNGQPEINAQTPTLELHIAVLRELILGAGVTLVEVPPLPAGHPFAVCLSHDVDHPLLRKQGLDHTAQGFLVRATLGSLVRLFKGSLSLRETAENLLAAIRFPFVQLGWAKDPWRDFDRYLEIEKGLASTFFVIPRANDPGKNVFRQGAEKRAAAYELKDIQGPMERIAKEGGELALHGIDAWTDLEAASAERDQVEKITGQNEMGVRMHWLCYDEQSPQILDTAGFNYDSSFGYNETIGYRAGTLQAFRPLGTKRILELPLHVMDTALFYPSYLNLSHRDAAAMLRRVVDDALSFGGVLTINWHDRSIAPERQWGRFYIDALAELKKLRPWFATASEVIAWFRLRRSAVLEEVRRDGKVVAVRVRADGGGNRQIPGMLLRMTTGTMQVADTEVNMPRCTESEFCGTGEIKLVS